MGCLNIIFGLRAINTTSTEEKPLSFNYGALNSKQGSVQNKALLIDEYLEEEDMILSGRKEQEISEVIF